MGLAFDPPRADLASALRGLVASRTTPIPSALPPKARRKPEAAGPRSRPEPGRPPQPARGPGAQAGEPQPEPGPGPRTAAAAGRRAAAPAGRAGAAPGPRTTPCSG